MPNGGPAVQDPLAEFSAQLDVLNNLADMLREGRTPVRATQYPIRLLDPGETESAYARLLASATRGIRSTTRMPLLGAPVWRQTAHVLETLRRGSRWQDIYEGSALDEDAMLGHLREVRAAGQQSRTLPRVPMKMVIADDRRALLGVSTGEGTRSLLIGRCGLIDDLADLFDVLWSFATPVADLPRPGEADPRISQDCRDLLALLATGATDEVIARQLGLSVRTVQRRVRQLEDALGARTRFQAGIQAARHHLI